MVLVSLLGVSTLVFAVMAQPQTEVATEATFLSMAAVLGLGTGGMFAWVGKLSPTQNVGAIIGGGLGGYFLPMMMGATYNLRPTDTVSD